MLRPDALIETACEQTGLSDFGGDSFREGLAVLCDSVSAEARLNPFGQMAMPGAIVGALSNRLEVTDWVKRHPGVADEQIEAPMVVIGMFRAGTTLLSYLLEKDPAHRPLFRWEAGNCVPPPTPETIADDPRIAATRATMAMMEQIDPRNRVVQSEEADGPTECISVTNQDFKSLVFEAMTNIPTYGAWLKTADMGSAYAWHKRVLQVLQSGGVRGRWSLKAPAHALSLEALTAVYPDARLVLTHRDPVVVVASACSLISTLTKTFSDADHSAYIGRHWTEMFERSVDGVNRFRDANPDKKIVDINYADLSRDPLGTMRRVYAECGEELGGEALAAMTAHVESHKKGRFGKHGYDPSEYGLNAGEIAERFRPYVERYDIPLETAVA
jgi:Sulfotransferase family